MRTYLIYGDVSALAEITSSQAFDPSLQNVADRRLKKVARSDDAYVQIDYVFSEPVYIGAVAMLNTNCSNNALNRWFSYSDNAFTNLVTDGAFTTGRDPEALQPNNLYGIAGDEVNSLCQSLRVIASVDTGPIEIGRIFVGRMFWAQEGGKFGSFSSSFVDPSIITRAYDGTPYITERQKYREAGLEFPALYESEMYLLDGTTGDARESLHQIERTVGSSQEAIIIPSDRGDTDDDALIIDGQAVYGILKWGKTEQYEKCNEGFLYRKTIEITESV